MKPEMQDAHGSKTYNTSEAAHRAMRRSKREITSASELRDVIGQARVLRVGFVDDEGMAVVPMNFGFEWNLASDGNGQELPTFWLHSAGEGRKAEAWASSPRWHLSSTWRAASSAVASRAPTPSPTRA